MDVLSDVPFSKRVEMHIVESIERKYQRKAIIDLLCLACAYLVNIKVDELFVCSGCEEGQGNQLGHDCVMLSSIDKKDIHFHTALNSIKDVDINVKYKRTDALSGQMAHSASTLIYSVWYN